MKKSITIMVIALILAVSALVFGFDRNTIDLEDVGDHRLWKVDAEHVEVQRTITDANGTIVPIYALPPFRLETAQAELTAAQAEYEVWDMNSVEAIRFVAKKKAIATVKVAIATAKVNKFSGAIDE